MRKWRRVGGGEGGKVEGSWEGNEGGMIACKRGGEERGWEKLNCGS